MCKSPFEIFPPTSPLSEKLGNWSSDGGGGQESISTGYYIKSISELNIANKNHYDGDYAQLLRSDLRFLF